jgi:radical SAM protein with 4Fe4S-binding SPASM domain
MGQFAGILDNTPKDVQIDFAGFCEPFLNQFASWMMRHAIQRGYKVFLLTTLTGFTESDAKILHGCYFDTILVHEYEGFNKQEQDDKLKQLLKSVTVDKVAQFPLVEEFRFSRASSLWDIERKTGKIECGWDNTFSRNVVMPNGDVYLCCMDYGLEHKIGNILSSRYDDLNRQSIIDLCSQESSELICRKCEIARC